MFQLNQAVSGVQAVSHSIESVKNAVMQARSLQPDGMTLEQVRVAMLQLMAEENSNHYRMGQLYNYVVDEKLAEQEGYEDARDFFSQKLADLSQPTLTTYGAVAKNFTEPLSLRFGVTCLYLLTIYKEVADMHINHEEPGPTVIEVPSKKGEVTPKPFSACSVDDMRRAIRRKRKPASSKPVPAKHVAQAAAYQKAVNLLMATGVNVKVKVRNEKGKSVLDITSLPIEDVEKLIEALMSQLPYGPKERKEVEVKAQPSA